jgi:hypothetical protein
MFTSKLDEITYEKIKRFCEEQNPEGETIEYKGAFPSNLEKSISAMANTYGGIVLIGVEADKTKNTPILPIKGIDLTKGLEERVTSICLRNIYPPYFPLVKICDFKNEKGEDKAVVFIRVYESDQTPHAINNNTDVYLRIKSQNEPFKKATIDEIEWLKNRRKKAVELRETILTRAEERYHTLSQKVLDESQKRRFRKSFVVPLYPAKQIVSCYELFGSVLRNLRASGFEVQASNLEMIGKTAREVVYYFDTPEGDSKGNRYIQYGEFSSYGLVLRKMSFWEDCYATFIKRFQVNSLLRQMYETFKISLLFYSSVGYNGLIRAGVDVQGFQSREIVRTDRSSPMGDESIVWNEVENQFSFTQDLLVIELEEKLDSVILEIYKQFLFTCGLGKDKNHLENVAIKHCSLIEQGQ